MFERWTDVLAGFATAAAVGFVVWQIARRRKQLRELMDMLDDGDLILTDELEELVRSGKLLPMDKLSPA